MKKMKSILALLLAAVMVLSIVACTPANPVQTNPTSGNQDTKPTGTQGTEPTGTQGTEPTEGEEPGITYPLNTDVQLRIYLQSGFTLPSGYASWDELPFLQGLEERWGVDIIWESAPVGADATAAYNLMLQDDDLPQIVWGQKASTDEIDTLVTDGVAMDISAMLEEYAPDYWAWLHNPDDPFRVKDPL